MIGPRTYVVPAWVHRDRDDWVDLGAESVGPSGVPLPPYLGVWVKDDRPWHMFSDYPAEVHERFGWRQS